MGNDGRAAKTVALRADGTGFQWFAARQVEQRVWPAWVAPCFGLVIGLVLMTLVSRRLGTIVLAVASTLLLISIVAPKWNLAIANALSCFGVFMGRIAAVVLLTPTYWIGFTAARVWSRFVGDDPLCLRDRSSGPTYWRPCAEDVQKDRYVRRMFATEARRWAAPGGGFRKLATMTLATMLLAEISLRILGFGTPILYMNDPNVGFMPVPNQDVRRYGGRVQLNQFAQRSPDYPYEKGADALRVLLIGDSTLYGGSYIDQSDLYSTLVAGKLQKALPDREVQIMSIGVNDWGPFNKTGYIRRYGSFDADIAVVCMPIIDVYRRLRHLEPGRSHFFLADRKPMCAISEILNFGRVRCMAQLNRWGAIELTVSSVFTKEQRELGVREYRNLADMLHADGCHVRFEILPSRHMGMVAPNSAKEHEDIQQLRLAVEDIASFGSCPGLFYGAGKVDAIYADEMHLAEAGHAVYSDYLTDRLMEAISALPSARAAAKNVARRKTKARRGSG